LNNKKRCISSFTVDCNSRPASHLLCGLFLFWTGDAGFTGLRLAIGNSTLDFGRHSEQVYAIRRENGMLRIRASSQDSANACVCSVHTQYLSNARSFKIRVASAAYVILYSGSCAG